MKKNLTLLSLVALFSLISCGKSSKLTYNESALSDLNPETQVTYSMIKSEILNKSCIGCHSHAATEAGLKAWITPGKPESSPFFIKTENGTMPKGGTPLTTRELELIKLYITQMGGTSPTTPPTTEPSAAYNKINAEILQPKCVSCHSFVGTEAGLKTWVTPGNPDTSKFFQKTKSGEMPKGGTPLTTAELELIRDYITNMSTTPTTPPVDDSKDGISFAEVKARILDPYSCTNCHKIRNESDLEDLGIKSDPADSEIFTMTKSGEMPKGGSRLTKADQEYLLQYLKEFQRRR